MDDYPTVNCPRCHAKQTDMDGFGFIACVPGCGYCTHPSRELKAGAWECDICGDRLPDSAPAQPAQEHKP